MSLLSKLRRALNERAGQGENVEIKRLEVKGGPEEAKLQVRAMVYRRGVGMSGTLFLDHEVRELALRTVTGGPGAVADLIWARLRNDPRHPDFEAWDSQPYDARLAEEMHLARAEVRYPLPDTVETVNVPLQTDPLADVIHQDDK